MIWNIVNRVLIGLVLAAGLFYAGDDVALRLKKQQTDTVLVRKYYSILIKGNKIDYEQAGTETDTCVNSILPHMGSNPCWYVKSHKRKIIEM